MNVLTIIIPVYNESRTILKVLEELSKYSFYSEVLVINDGSTDGTGEILKKLDIPKVRIITHKQNSGYGASLKTGIRQSRSEYIAVMDGDGQHDPSQLRKLYEVLETHDMVVGARVNNSSEPFIRQPGKLVLKYLVEFLSRRKIPDFNSGLRILKKPVIEKYLNLMPDGFSFSTTSTVALNSMNYLVKYVPVTVQRRKNGDSAVKLLRDGGGTIMLIINLIALFNPMRVFLPTSLLFFAFSLFHFIFYSFTIRIHVTPSMIMVFLTGVIIFFQGIVCEQISALRRNQQTPA